MSEGGYGEPISAGATGRRGQDELEVRFESGIDLAQIRALLGQARERAGAPVERVLTLNLVGVHFSGASWGKAVAALEAASGLHPARIVALIAEPKSAHSSVTARVSVKRPPGSSFFLERIVLTAAGTAVRHLESAMLGLLVPEVPVVIVWGGRAEGELIQHATEIADRVILDSGSRAPDGLRHVANLAGRGAPIGDLAWARIFPWQSLAADVLDIPNLREHRGNLRSARITTAGPPGAEALLLAGWLQSRVRQARVALVEGPATGLPEPLARGEIAELQFEAPPAEFVLRREARGILEAQVRGDDDGEVVHRTRLPADSPGRLLVLELKLLHGIDEVYAAALDEAARFAELRGGRR